MCGCKGTLGSQRRDAREGERDPQCPALEGLVLVGLLVAGVHGVRRYRVQRLRVPGRWWVRWGSLWHRKCRDRLDAQRLAARVAKSGCLLDFRTARCTEGHPESLTEGLGVPLHFVQHVRIPVRVVDPGSDAAPAPFLRLGLELNTFGEERVLQLVDLFARDSHAPLLADAG